MDQISLQGRVAKLFVPVFIVLIIALALQVAGFATPGWMIVTYGDEWHGIVGAEAKVEIGLWASRLCMPNGECKSYDVTSSENIVGNAMSTEMLEYQVETSVALLLLVLAIVLYICMRCGSCKRHDNLRTSVYCTFIFALVSGGLALAAAGKFGNNLRKAHDLLFRKISFEFPYSPVLTGLGGLLAGLIALVILFSVQPWKSDTMPPPAYAMTAQPTVVVYPGPPQPGYNNQGQPMYPYPGQPQPGYNNQGQPMYPYPGQPQPGYMDKGQPTAPYEEKPSYGQPN